MKEIKNLIKRQELLDWRKLKPFQPQNLKVLTKENYDRLRNSLLKNNFIAGFHVWAETDGTGKTEYWILDGHHRKYVLDDLAREGYTLPATLPCSIVDVSDKKQAIEFLLTYSSEYAHPDPLGVSEFIHTNDLDFDTLAGFIDLRGVDILALKLDSVDTPVVYEEKKSLSDRFLVPPFSVLDARQGYWQERKRSWLNIGIKSELGRGDNVLFDTEEITTPGLNFYRDKTKVEKARTYGRGLTSGNKYGKCLETGIGAKYGREEMTGTSVFDPVLCELAYRWFSPPGGTVIDPFAGGSVRGIVAAKVGRLYVGVELRAEQVEANRLQWDEIGRGDEAAPVWQIGDSRYIKEYAKGVEADFVFSCPPYADLEVYSDNPADISTLEYSEFIKAYRLIIAETCGLLKNDRFACFVVGDVRAKDGTYRNFVSDTIQAFIDAGLKLYNEAILVTVAGSLPIRAGKQFTAGRKLGKTHQNVLVFVKGDAKRATEACGEVEVYDPTEEASESETDDDF
ncbi:hypothetical protein AQUSIP_13190 [Aquicella siphonis]|uniref:DNA methylase N-4/N-6 domain-containing protein n=1 Tax=Aquicella siphonis TaxID=254247 RepID=A0A5E4PHL8_9COXI|nr:hypothetical protein [Aquicella siphonis]VVC76018.1 hypothetical protein AQUSIP_13190 [Aquicella siphonis]